MGDAPGKDFGKDPDAESIRRMKRSATISLVLVAGAGAAAFGLARLDPSQREEDALVYGTVGACIAEGRRKPEDCTAAEAAARRAYAATAPRYETEADCERHHGRGGCVPGATVTAEAQDRYLPVMAASCWDRRRRTCRPSRSTPMPRRRSGQAQGGTQGGSHAGGHGFGYCTGTGARIVPVGGSSRVHVPSTVARTVATTPRMVSRGGFGGTGRAMASSGGHGGGHAGGSGG